MDQTALKSEPTYSQGVSVRHFKERAPWWGGDLQTLRNHFRSSRSPVTGSSSVRTFPTSDGSGDRLTGTLERPSDPGKGPLILLIHGLTGCEDSSYVRESARFHLERSRPVLRLNLRGVGVLEHKSREFYHAGSASDLQDVLDGLQPEETAKGVFAIGFSLGGNILLNFLGGPFKRRRLIGAATVSAPIKPLEASRRIMAPRNALYQRFLLQRMKRDVLSSAELSTRERQAIKRAASVYEFDDIFVAPRNGFRDAPDYYERTAGARHVAAINVPTLMLHACNDPWIPVSPYHDLQRHASGNVRVITARSGGHVGFHESGCPETWHDRQIDGFLNTVAFRENA